MKLITAIVRPETLDEVVRVVAGNGACGRARSTLQAARLSIRIGLDVG